MAGGAAAQPAGAVKLAGMQRRCRVSFGLEAGPSSGAVTPEKVALQKRREFWKMRFSEKHHGCKHGVNLPAFKAVTLPRGWDGDRHR